MSELFNTKTRTAESLAAGQIDQAVLSGTHSYASDADVNVIDPSGNTVSVKGADLKDAIAQGYKTESPLQFASRKYVDENEGLKGSTKVALREAADQLSFGVTDAILKKTETDVEKAQYESLKAKHQAASIFGNVGGFGASLLYGGPLFQTAAKAGKIAQGASKVATSSVAAALIERGLGKSTAEKLAGTIAEEAITRGAQLGVEGAVVVAPKAITEAMLGDPGEAAETLGWGLGLGAIIGGVGGPLYKAYEKSKGLRTKAEEFALSKMDPDAFKALKAEQLKNAETAKEAKTAAEAMMAPAEGRAAVTEAEKLAEREAKSKLLQSVETPENADLLKALNDSGTPIENQISLSEMMRKKKGNANEIAQAMERQGLADKTMAMQLSDSVPVQRIESQIIESFSGPGFAKRAQYDAIQNQGIERPLMESLGIKSAEGLAPVNPSDSGSSIAKMIKEQVEMKYDQLNKAYDVINKYFPAIPVNEKGIEQIARNIERLKIDGVETLAKRPNSDVAQFLKTVSKDLRLQETLQELKVFKTKLREYSGPQPSHDVKEALSLVRDKISEAETRYIKQDAMRMKNPEARDKILSLIEFRSEADAGYRKFREMMEDIAPQLGLKKQIKTPSDMINFLEDVDGEKLFKVLSKSKKLDLLEAEMPEAAKAFLDLKRADIIANAIENNRVKPGKVISELDQLPWEVKAKLLVDPVKYADAKTIRDSFKVERSVFNPSQTNVAREAQGFIKQSAQDYMLGKLVDKVSNVEAILLAGKAQEKAQEQLSRIPEVVKKAIDNVKKNARPASIGAGARMFDQKGDYEDFMKRIRESLNKSSSQPDIRRNKQGDWVNWTRDQGAPKVAEALGMHTERAFAYLESQVPRPITPNPLVKYDFKPSDAESYSFSRKLDVALNPFSIIDDIGNNSVTKDQLGAMQAIYPMLYNKIRGEVLNQVTETKETVPYQARLKFSLLFDAPLDVSLQKTAQLQGTYQQKPEPPSPSNAKLSLAKNSMTQVQRLGA
jgi:hypothetical protein